MKGCCVEHLRLQTDGDKISLMFGDTELSSLTIEREIVSLNFATGSIRNEQDFATFNSRIEKITDGYYRVWFDTPHPNGADYSILFGQEEAIQTKDMPKVAFEAGVQGPNGFTVMVTTDDNGPAPDPFSLFDYAWCFAVPYEKEIIISIAN